MVIYILVRIFLFLIAIIPFWLLYLISDFFTILIFYVIKYRKKVVLRNLQASFPEKSPQEIKNLAYQFYKNFCDVTFETLKSFYISPKLLEKRYTVINPELSGDLFRKGKSIMYVGSHYSNWEWGTQTLGNQLDHLLVGIYKPLSNKYLDDFIKRHRAKMGCILKSIFETSQMFRATYPKPAAFTLIGDQSPSDTRKVHWVKFLNRETACLQGIETYSKILDLPIVYLDVQRVKRGYYTLNQILLTDNPKSFSEKGSITKLYMNQLEEIIKAKPQDWLWSHRRWKLTPDVE